MRALVVYESMYGNTHVVASNIADGLRGTYEVTLMPVAEATADLIAGADLVVVGAPTHMHGLNTLVDREAARARRWGEALAAAVGLAVFARR